MNDRVRNSKRPYLIRAMHAWMMDNGETPHVIVDATIAPILWRMRRYVIELPPTAQAMSRYAATILARPTFRASLSDAELEMGLVG